AASRAPGKHGLVRGEAISVHDLILGIVTKSANDAAVVLAETLGGSEGAFAQQMTWKARQLGMNSTVYYNANGLPDPNQRTTARDIARLALALYHQFPREYRYFSTRAFVFRGQEMRNHNHMMEWYPGLDGIKTGYVNASGFNLAASRRYRHRGGTLRDDRQRAAPSLACRKSRSGDCGARDGGRRLEHSARRVSRRVGCRAGDPPCHERDRRQGQAARSSGAGQGR